MSEASISAAIPPARHDASPTDCKPTPQHKKPTPKPPSDAPIEGETHLPAGRFGTVTVYIPEGNPKSVAIFLQGMAAGTSVSSDMANALVNAGAVVIGWISASTSPPRQPRRPRAPRNHRRGLRDT